MGDQRILMGVVTGAHGIRGEVKLKSFTAEPEAVASYGPLDSARGPITITRLRPQKDVLIASLAGVDDRNAAEALQGLELYLPRDRLPAPAQNEFYLADLVGLSAVTPEGRPFGKVVGLANFGAGDLVEIAREGERETLLVPVAKPFVSNIDLDQGRVTIDYAEES
jgi:16S rRNA processing protein RimM